jgi:hypothetical protein
MKESKIDLSDKELQALFHFFDQDDSGTINFEEFLAAVRLTFLSFLPSFRTSLLPSFLTSPLPF